MSLVTEKLSSLPQLPGVYIFKNGKGDVLYVGKAKRLSARVRSYFRENANLDPAKQHMIPKIADLETIATDTETEALVLEANLIRQHQPPYNVVLRDDKYYLFIKITNEDFPRIFPVRRLKRDGGRYFGPYSSSQSVRATLALLRRLFPYRGEKDTPHDKIFPHPLFAQSRIIKGDGDKMSQSSGDAMGGPIPSPAARGPVLGKAEGRGRRDEARDWEGTQTRQDPQANLEQTQHYRSNIANIIRFLSGHRQEIIDTLRRGMKAASAAKEFERAAIFRNQLQALERLEGNQKVFLPRAESFDMISIAQDLGRSAANIFQVRTGKLLGKQTFLLRHRQATHTGDVLRQFLLQYYSVAQDIPQTIFIPLPLTDQASLAAWITPLRPPTFVVPKRGKKRQLLAMGEKNAALLLTQEQAAFITDARLAQATQALAEALHVQDKKLHRIETYDISNIQGKLATASMVVFLDGKPASSQYRKFRMHLEGKPNDFAMIQETLERRFAARHADWPLPDLIIIDGGKGQLSAALSILRTLKLEIPIISIAKREEEIFQPGQARSLRLPFDSPALHLIQRMRDEAHRFTISYHRLLRSKSQQRSLLDEIPGIGPTLKRRLLNHFGSLKNIRTASQAELEKILGPKKTEILRDYL